MTAQQEMINKAEELAASQEETMKFIGEILADIELFKLSLTKAKGGLNGRAFIAICDARHCVKLTELELSE